MSVRGSYSTRVPRSSLAEVHREFVHHIVEDEVDGQEEGKDDKREVVKREESGVVEESQHTHERMAMCDFVGRYIFGRWSLVVGCWLLFVGRWSWTRKHQGIDNG